MTAKRTAFVPAVVSRCRIPGHQGIRFSQVDAGGFSPVGELAPTGRQAQSARPSARTPFCKLAFDVALEAKNSLSVSAMAANRRPLALFLNSSASFPHRCRIFRQTSAGRASHEKAARRRLFIHTNRG